MKNLTKRIVSENVVLYYLWFKLLRLKKKSNIDFFERDTNAFLTGYPRSGNTFLTHLSKQLLPKSKFVHHLHKVAPIKIALYKNLPVYVLIRNPMDAISSNYLKHYAMRSISISKQVDTEILKKYVHDYQCYYKFVLKKREKINVINFQKLVGQPKILMNQIACDLKIHKELSDKDIEMAILSYRGATDTFGSSKPNEKKEFYKNIVKDKLGKLDEWPKVQRLYKDIIGENKC